MHAGKSDINVTPFIDILLVLLIIFMVITPLSPTGLAAHVPAKPDVQMEAPDQNPIVLELASDGQLSINGSPIRPDNLRNEIQRVYATRAIKVLFLKAHKSLHYGEVARLIDRVKGMDPVIRVALMP